MSLSPDPFTASLPPVTWAVLVLTLVAASGLALAQLKVRGLGVGVTGVLFTGILAGHFGLHLETSVLEFVRDFGLVLFVFTIGLQLGPNFFASFRREGLKLNALAVIIVFLGTGVTVALVYWLRFDPRAALGIFSGATTNTPSLGATQQLLKTLDGAAAGQAGLPALAYAAVYPGAVAGIISVILLLRALCDDPPETTATAPAAAGRLERVSLIVESPDLNAVPVSQVPLPEGAVISRLKKLGAWEATIATGQSILHRGDTVLVVGPRKALEKARLIIGEPSRADLLQSPGKILSQKIMVSQRDLPGKTIADLDLSARFQAVVTRVERAELELPANPEWVLQFGDILQVVGEESALEQIAERLGDRVEPLRETRFLPVFIGIALGAVLGAVPIAIPHLPVPVQLGMAGGPLIVALLLSRIGRIGPLVWYMPAPVNLAFRELGIVLFLACVGLKAGPQFFATVFSVQGWHWFLAGLAVTLVPLLLAAGLARAVFKFKFATISGVLAGSMTDPPALAFAHSVSASDVPLTAYAAVYPLTMLLRIFIAQILVVLLCH